MLQGKFFNIVSLDYKGENSVSALLTLNRESDIFKGHFPNNPVVPGVCSVQIISELAEIIAGRELRLVHGNNIKFTAMINPDETPDIKAEIKLDPADDLKVFVNAVITGDGNPFVKFTGYFI